MYGGGQVGAGAGLGAAEQRADATGTDAEGGSTQQLKLAVTASVVAAIGLLGGCGDDDTSTTQEGTVPSTSAGPSLTLSPPTPVPTSVARCPTS